MLDCYHHILLLKISLADLLSLAWEPPEDEHPVFLFLGAPPRPDGGHRS